MNFETIILKSLIYDPSYFGKALSVLDRKHFQTIGNAETFRLIKDYYNQYHERPQEIALVAMIKDVANSDVRTAIVNALKEVSQCELNKNTQFMLDETVKFIKDFLFYKMLEIGSEGLAEKNEDKKQQAKKYIDEIAKVQIDSDLGLDFRDINHMIEYYQERNIGIKTNHIQIDTRLGSGFLPGTLNVILASQGIGKSLLMCDFVSNMLSSGNKILYLSLEMSEEEVMKRIHANVLNINVNEFADISKTDGEIQGLHRPPVTKDMILGSYDRFMLSGNVGVFAVKAYAPGTFSSLMLRDLLDKYHNEKQIDFDIVMVDYLGIMKSDILSPSAGLYSYIKSIGEELRAVAVDRRVPIISASQLNRGSVNKTDGVDNSFISDSVGTAATADCMMFILQNESMKENKEIVIKFTKNRYTGKTDSFMMDVDYNHMKYLDRNTDFNTMEQKQQADNTIKTTISEISKTVSTNNANNANSTNNSNGSTSINSSDDIMAILGFS